MVSVILNDFYFDDYEDDDKLKQFIVENTLDIVTKNPDSIQLFNDKSNVFSRTYFYDMYDYIREEDTPYVLVGFFDKELTTAKFEEPIGFALFYKDNPWYSSACSLQEILTVSFKRGSGIAGAVADWMESYAKEEGIHLIGAACANSPFSKMVANTYKKKGFKMYPTFYKEI